MARGAGGDGVDVGEADVIAVEAIGLVDLFKSGIVGLDECDIDALRAKGVHCQQTVPLASTTKLLPPERVTKRGGVLTENSAAPWAASSTSWIVALSPALGFTPLGNGICGRQTVPG